MSRLARWFIAVTLLLGTVIVIILGYWLKWDWTGFKGKTLWDWLNLLGVLAIPAVVGFGTIWFTSQQGKASDAANTQQRETELQIASDNQREAALQEYINAMSELLLEKGLSKSKEDDDVRDVARIRTLTILRRLDGERKRSVLQFLREADLIRKEKPVIFLDGADLTGANLNDANLSRINLMGANLENAYLYHTSIWEANLQRANFSNANLKKAGIWGTDLSGANLSSANFSHTNLMGANLNDANLSNAFLWNANLGRADLIRANLMGANLRDADIGDANLSYTNLSGTKVTKKQLKQAKSLHGATLSDGSKYF